MPRKKKPIKVESGNGEAKQKNTNDKLSDPDSSVQCGMSDDEKLQKELNWCIEQLRLGLMTQKSTPKQVQESVRLIKILSSSTAPLVKKRQIMRQTFGDYRKKISDEENRWSKEAEKVKKKSQITNSYNVEDVSVYLRTSSHKTDGEGIKGLVDSVQKCKLDELGDQHSEKETEKNTTNANTLFNEENANSEFKFNFNIPDS